MNAHFSVVNKRGTIAAGVIMLIAIVIFSLGLAKKLSGGGLIWTLPLICGIIIFLMALMILNASAETAAILTPDGMEWTAPAAGEAVTLEKDLGVIVENVYYSVYTPAGLLVTALGEPAETVSSPSCVFEGEDFEYNYDFGSIYSSPIEGEDI
jgi:uncharacterized membrane protein